MKKEMFLALFLLGLSAVAEENLSRKEDFKPVKIGQLDISSAFQKFLAGDSKSVWKKINWMNKPEGTYLIWLDFRETGLSAPELDDRIIRRAHLWLDSGAIFGKAGEGFQRINTACPRSTLCEALERLEKAFPGG